MFLLQASPLDIVKEKTGAAYTVQGLTQNRAGNGQSVGQLTKADCIIPGQV
jgi:hypothetical protein